MIKRLILSAAILSASVFAMAQTQTVTHIVQRGETIESIAEYYHVSVDDINKANPNAEGLIYTGMKLVVPVQQSKEIKTTQTTTVTTQAKEATNNYTSLAEGTRHDNTIHEEKKESPWVYAGEFGYGFFKGSSNLQYEITFGANYRFPFNLYAGARIGYNSGNYNMAVKGDGEHVRNANWESNYHFIEVPLEVGYMLTTTNKKWGIVPFAGINANIGLTGKEKYKELGSGGNSESKKLKIGGKLGLEAKIGLRIRLIEILNISGSYRIPLNDKQKEWFGKDAYPEISIAWGF